MNNIIQSNFMQGFINLCDKAYKKGWHERNGGNASYRIKPEEIAEVRDSLRPAEDPRPIGLSLPNIADEYFLVTGGMKFFMNIKAKPRDNICIIKIGGGGENYSLVWGLESGGAPTSELPTHLLNHSVKKEATGGAHRVIMHSHPANIIALTFILPLDSKTFTREIWETANECAVVFPAGIGVIPWMVPGGPEVALAGAEMIKKHDIVVWPHHGIFCSGEDFDLTFGLTDTVEKTAEILIKVLSCGGKRQKIEAEGIRSLARTFNLDIDFSIFE